MTHRDIIAILRGVTPEEAVDIGHALVEAGIDTLEVPLNSPRPLASIERLAAALGERTTVGAGTVLSAEEVRRVADAGGRIVVSPNTDAEVIAATKRSGLDAYPGILTPSEAFSALRAGADALKIFPASLLGPSGLAALRAVLPPDTRVFAVGGAEPSSFARWFAAGVTGFGIGSALYRPGRTAEEVGAIARELCAVYDETRPARAVVRAASEPESAGSRA